ncbi:hypothetical protein WICMUC_003758 [Wickerhamomyces mucosus]|uniref:Uncharacterized protein n=1 Tax=Wickerhamomyces mucosus TaxID=1378264 RepID=A0A9P8PJH8_9ASCO|nr:hypothetical protein WICMUC_003758 [Wickerhamomyces mucosus]
MVFGSNLTPSLKAIVINLDFISLAEGLLNGISKVHLSKGLIFGDDLSLQIKINGACVFLANEANSPTPPLSPPDIPSTSSIIIQNLLLFCEALLKKPTTEVLFKTLPMFS